MKKLSLLLFSIFLFFICAGFARADERIHNFNSIMQVHEDGSVTVEESITVNVEHISIRRGIYRDIPNPASERVKFVSLYMDNQPHPSFTENYRNSLRINFGDDNYISKGIHTYKLTYSVANVVKDFPDYDEVYWNVTGNDWNFMIENASFTILLPSGADIKNDLVSLYTGIRGEKFSNAVKTGQNSFKTTSPLYQGEGFTVAVPFEKGIVKSHKKSLFGSLSRKTIMFMSAGLLMLAFLIIYSFLSWLAVGKDPKDVTVTEFAPPKGISPAFMRCLWKRGNDRKMFATALVSLAMKDRIEITEEKIMFQKQAVLKLKDDYTEDLPEEEKFIIKNLFARNDELTINQTNWPELAHCINFIEKGFNIEKAKYIKSNRKFIIPFIIVLLLFQLLFIPFGPAAMGFIFINLHYTIFLSVFVNIPKNKTLKLIAFILINLFYSIFFIAMGLDSGIEIAVVQISFLLSLWTLLIYMNIMYNLTEAGRELFKHINGFYRYMSIAEEHRVAMSVPVDDEKIFADYLPYAFAFDMENKWMKRFEKVLSQATIDRYTHNIGGQKAFLSRGFLVYAINSAAPKSSGSSGSGGSGSGGGGSSGGGSGGGGGGGR